MTARTIPMGVKGTSLHICTRTKGLTCILLSNVGKKIEARRGATSAITWLRRKKAGIPPQETWMESFSHYARLELNMQNTEWWPKPVMGSNPGPYLISVTLNHPLDLSFLIHKMGA